MTQLTGAMISMNWVQADSIANEIVSFVQPYCDKILVCGGIRRSKADVHDIDIVVKLNEEKTAPLYGGLPIDTVIEKFAATFLRKRDNLLTKFELNGEAIKKFYYKDMKVEFWIADDITRHFDCLCLIRTGSLDFNKSLAHHAKQRGWTLHASGAGLCKLAHFKLEDREYNPKSCEIITHSEREIIQLLLGRYYEPNEREVWAIPEAAVQAAEIQQQKKEDEQKKRDLLFYIRCPCNIEWFSREEWDQHKAIKHPRSEAKIER